MKVANIGSRGTIYQIEDSFDGHVGSVLVNITYSGYEDESGNEILEFECATIVDEDNPSLTVEQIDIFNKELDCGREEEYVQILIKMYEVTGIKFDIGEYKYNPVFNRISEI